MLAIPATAADTLGSAQRISDGLETGPIRYVAALALVAVAILFILLLRVQALRIRELKDIAEKAEKLGILLQQHNTTMQILEKTIEWVSSQQPRRRTGETQPPPARAAAKP